MRKLIFRKNPILMKISQKYLQNFSGKFKFTRKYNYCDEMLTQKYLQI